VRKSMTFFNVSGHITRLTLPVWIKLGIGQRDVKERQTAGVNILVNEA